MRISEALQLQLADWEPTIRHTYWYLTAVPELLALGSARGAKALAGQKGVAHE